MAIDLDNAVVCVTGGARGIGRDTARLLAERGADVLIGDIDLAAAEQTAREIGVRAAELDVSDPESFAAFLARPERPVSMLVNNAGIMHVGRFTDLALDAHLREIQIDLAGVVIGMRLVLPGMLERDHGHIVNVSSMAGKLTLPGIANYNATKFGVAALSRAVRAEIADTRVTISTIMPSAVRTELTSGISTKGAPTNDPVDIAAAIVDSARHPRREITFPRWAALGGIAEAALPESISIAAKRRIAGNRLIDDVDRDKRTAYNART